jgi:hypothetical protein
MRRLFYDYIRLYKALQWGMAALIQERLLTANDASGSISLLMKANLIPVGLISVPRADLAARLS